MLIKKSLRVFILLGTVSLLVGCGLNPVRLSPNISTSGVDASNLQGRTIYLDVRDSRSDPSVGSVIGDDETITLKASRSPVETLRYVLERTLKGYGMIIVPSVSNSDNQMFVSIKDLEYFYPVPAHTEKAETSATLRISLAGERTAHENIISTWARYEGGYPRGPAVSRALSDVLGRATGNALRERKMISVLEGN